MLTELEKKIIAAIQGDIAITKHPYRDIADKLKISEDTLLKKLEELCAREIIRRFGVTIRHQKSGFSANVMVAWQVEESSVNDVGLKLASFREVSHCYRRSPLDKWAYNLYTMVHGANEKSCVETARKMSEQTSVNIYTLLFSKKELKKTSMQYFSLSRES